MSNARKIIEKLELQAHPEGGYFKEIYRSGEVIQDAYLPERYKGNRSFSTSIYFLLDQEDKSHFHRILSDEIWHFYSGSPILIHCIDNDGQYRIYRLGNNLEKEELPQIIISRTTWFAAEVENKNDYALIGCTVAPGFEFMDFELGSEENLKELFPQHADLIKKFTRS